MGNPGRPPIYDPVIAAAILVRLADGESLKSICRDEGMPNRSTVQGWAFDDVDGFYGKYVRAREIQAHALADETVEISDDGSNDWMQSNDPENPGYRLNGEHVQRSRLRVDTRKWFASKLASKTYGDKVTQEHSGKDGAPIEVKDVTAVEAARRIAFALTLGAQQVKDES